MGWGKQRKTGKRLSARFHLPLWIAQNFFLQGKMK